MAEPKRGESRIVFHLREAIRASGRTLRDISREAGLSPSQLSHFLRGRRDLTFSSAAKVIEALGLELTPAKKSRPRKGENANG
jgi:DNA-binding phage protein